MPGTPGQPCTRPTRVRGPTSCTTAASYSRVCPSSPAVRSSPLRPRRCRRASVGSATGTTATPGCATRASRWRRSGSPPARTRPDDFFAFLATAAASSVGPDHGLQIMFGIGGEHDLSERTLPHLEGWRNSAPVRVGNGAWDQRQIDVYGELLGAALRLADQLDAIDEDTRRFLIACADCRGVALDREGPGHLGGARRPAALPLLQGHVLGRAGPRDLAGRPARRRTTGSTGGSACARRSGRPSSATGGTSRPTRSRSTWARPRWTRRT